MQPLGLPLLIGAYFDHMDYDQVSSLGWLAASACTARAFGLVVGGQMRRLVPSRLV